MIYNCKLVLCKYLLISQRGSPKKLDRNLNLKYHYISILNKKERESERANKNGKQSLAFKRMNKKKYFFKKDKTKTKHNKPG